MNDSTEQNEPGIRGGVGCGLLIGVLLSVLILGILAVIFDFSGEDDQTSSEVFIVVFYLALGVVSLIVMKYFRISLRELTGSVSQFNENIRYAGWVLPLIGISICTALLILVTFAAIDDTWYYRYLELGEQLSWPADAPFRVHVLMFISVVILAPVVEEYIFRGILLSSWSVKWGTTRAILLSSFIFGIFHIDPFGAFIAGVVLCLIYYQTGSMLLVILIHMINNGLAVFGMFAFPDMFQFETPGETGRYLWYIIPALVLLIVLMWPMIRRLWPEENAAPPVIRSNQ